MSGTAGQELLETVVAKLAISETLARYSRGVDRCDLATLKSVFWPDAVVNYGDADQNGWEWCEGVVVALRELERTQHAIGNVLIDLDGPVATAETYCRAYHEVRTPDGNQEFMVGGRYLDRIRSAGRGMEDRRTPICDGLQSERAVDRQMERRSL